MIRSMIWGQCRVHGNQRRIEGFLPKVKSQPLKLQLKCRLREPFTLGTRVCLVLFPGTEKAMVMAISEWDLVITK